jgi:Zn-finger nucleic acid-binding protein
MMKCPMCEHSLPHVERNGTHIYICPECSFVGLEYLGNKDLENLSAELNERA